MNRSGTGHSEDNGVQVVVEVSKGGRIKWGANGRLDFVSPIACPFNYGSIPNILGPDGDPLDVVVLGPKLPRGSHHNVVIVGRIGFQDAGVSDDKWVGRLVSLEEPERVTNGEKRRVERFFRVYGVVKCMAHWIKGTGGATGFLGSNWGPHLWNSSSLG